MGESMFTFVSFVSVNSDESGRAVEQVKYAGGSSFKAIMAIRRHYKARVAMAR